MFNSIQKHFIWASNHYSNIVINYYIGKLYLLFTILYFTNKKKTFS